MFRRILNLGGSAVDAAIAVLLCVGVYNCHSCGIGGGFLMNIYDMYETQKEKKKRKLSFGEFRNKKECIAIDAREAAPSNAHERMFVDGNPPPSSFSGGMSIGIPGEIAGYWAAHKQYGKLPWSVLFRPAIDMCNEGITVEKALAFSILQNKKRLWEHRPFRFILKNVRFEIEFVFVDECFSKEIPMKSMDFTRRSTGHDLPRHFKL